MAQDSNRTQKLGLPYVIQVELASSFFSYLIIKKQTNKQKHPEASRLFAEINKNAKAGRQTILKCCTF